MQNVRDSSLDFKIFLSGKEIHLDNTGIYR